MTTQVRLSTVTTELLQLRDYYESLAVAYVCNSGNEKRAAVYDQVTATTCALDELLAKHEALVLTHRKAAR